MIRRILAICVTEFIVAFRNRWVLTAILLMAVFSTVLTFAGSSPVGSLGVDLLTVAVASMTMRYFMASDWPVSGCCSTSREPARRSACPQRSPALASQGA